MGSSSALVILRRYPRSTEFFLVHDFRRAHVVWIRFDFVKLALGDRGD